MGAAHGSLTYTVYFVVEEPPEGFKDAFLDALRKHAFRDIDINAGKDRSIGWCALGNPFDLELSWEKVFVDPYVCLSLREDLIRIPKAAFQAHLERKERELLKKEGRETMKKSERANLKAMVLQELRHRALADIRTTDVVWNTGDGTIRLFTHSKSMQEQFEDIVRDTWGLKIVMSAPYTLLAARGENGAELASQLMDLEPADFVGTPE